MKKHLSLILSALLLFTSGMTAAAFTPETVESAAEIAESLPASEAKALEDEIDIPLLERNTANSFSIRISTLRAQPKIPSIILTQTTLP